MHRLGSHLRRYALDVVLAIAVVGSAFEVSGGSSSREPETSTWLAVLAVVLIVLPLRARHRSPFAAGVAVWVVAVAVSFLDGRIVVTTVSTFAAGLVAAFLLGHRQSPARARVGLGVVLAGSLIVVLNDPAGEPANVVFIPLLFSVAALAGVVLGERSAQARAAEERADFAAREREAAARIAVAEERGRIAREMHDVVAHAVSVMVLQVGAVRHGLPAELDEDRRALMAVEKAGRTALAEMRHLLGAMREAGDDLELAPQRGVEGFPALIEDVGRAGLPVRLRVGGTPVPLPMAIDYSVYRIVQEGLTNALKHARASEAGVELRYGGDELQIEVSDDGREVVPGDGLGHGLTGVRERVKIHGGEMSAGPRPGGGFVLRARLPLNGYGR
jgi:signal transduction histidine kinase